MDKILDRQNQPELLKILCASRLLYNRAETLNHLVWVLTIATPIVSVFFNAIKKDTTPVYYISTFVVFFVSLLIEVYLQHISKKASTLRCFFCDNVLGFDESTINIEKQRIYEAAEKEVMSQKVTAQTQMKNSGKDNPPGVKDWYEIPRSVNEEDAVFACQKCDAWWDTKIRKSCSKWVLTVIIGITLILYLGSAFLHCSFLFLLYSALGLLGKTVLQTVLWIKYYNLSKEIDGIIESMSIDHTKKHEQHLQQKLNERRNLPVFHLNQVYKKVANNLSMLYNSTNT